MSPSLKCTPSQPVKNLPSGKDIGLRDGHHERWGGLVKSSGLAGDLDPQLSAGRPSSGLARVR
jgi:hypothetical protein